MVCSARKHPLSSVSGRRRYNTLDLCTAKSCANRALSPLLETQNPRDLLSLWNPSSFTHLYPQTEKQVCDYRSINVKKSHSRSSGKKRKDCEIFVMPHSLKQERFMRHMPLRRYDFGTLICVPLRGRNSEYVDLFCSCYCRWFLQCHGFSIENILTLGTRFSIGSTTLSASQNLLSKRYVDFFYITDYN